MIDRVREAVLRSEPFRVLLEQVQRGEAHEILLSGAAGSFLAVLASLIHGESALPLFVVARDREAAEQLRDDLLLLEHQDVAYFAGDHSKGSDPGKDAVDVQALRSIATGESAVMVTHPAALLIPVPPPSAVRTNILNIDAGGVYALADIRKELDRLNFERTDFVQGPGEYAVRGGILDIFPFTGDSPIRVEFFGETVESLRQFDPLSQRSIKDLSMAVIVPDLYRVGEEGAADDRVDLTSYLPRDMLVLFDDRELVDAAFSEALHSASEKAPEAERALDRLKSYRTLSLVRRSIAYSAAIDFGCAPQPAFNGSIKHLHANLSDLIAQGYSPIITCDGQAEMARLKELLSTANDEAEKLLSDDVRTIRLDQIAFSLQSVHGGFTLPHLAIALYTEHQIFGRVRRRGHRHGAKFKGFTQKELQHLRRGDYVVHRDYGIGRFLGLKKIRVRNAEQEVVSVQYEGNDMLYVNLNYIQRLQKYSSKEGHLPKLNKLGSNDWEKLKARVKARVKDIARDLINLYARRKHIQGFSFRADTPWQKELEASFMYEDTFDQAKATREVKSDMELPNPMDRLICGDVGFGKTEVAIRAAFKAVADGKQVAVLVPTTILAMQHYRTFADRVARYGVNLQVLSRFKSPKEQKVIIAELGKGSVDVVIGTHRLLSKDVAFKDLGLLVIDEEHRFGVTAKEKLRLMRTNVDTLSLTATPIPRTLHFSLMGARDLSIIATPPRNRLPIVTQISPWNDDMIREAVRREINRGGQVYFVHDRVQNMDDILARLQDILPAVRIRSAHGQMHTSELESVMMDFLEKKCDVLVSTKIIESGLDIPNVNTIIINRADRFGMAELYQLRGRVGRTNVQAYAYLITPPVSILAKPTVQRLQALEEFNELGSGFNLAMRDLEIRGAGNLLGGEQSGFIETMGFETYTRVLEEAIQELKDDEFRDLFANEERRSAKGDVVVDADVDALIPDHYINNDAERLTMYRRLYAAASEDQLREIADELRDRFGPVPPEVDLLFGVVRVRLTGSQLGFVRMRIGDGSLEAEFPPESEIQFYESEGFQHLMTAISHGRGKRQGLRQEGATLVFHATLQQNLDQAGMLQQALRVMTELVHSRESVRKSTQKDDAPAETGRTVQEGNPT